MAVLASDVVPEEPVVRDDRVYRLAAGTELLGEYLDAGYQTAKFLVRRSDGQLMQLPLLLYRVAASLDGRTADEIALDLTADLGQELTGEQVSYLVQERLRLVGLVATEPSDDEAAVEPVSLVRSDPLLALKYRVGVVPPAVTWRIAGVFRPLFHRPVWVLGLLAFVTADLLVVLQRDLSGRLLGGVGQMVQQPVTSLLVFGGVLLALSFHECGHVAACRYGGARPGNMGVGLYLVWPAFYSTVTDSYRLNRVGRLRTDLGGVYFNALFMAGTTLVYLRTGEPWLLVFLLLMHVETAWQFLPSIRFDGYYMLSDLVGVAELFAFVRPVLSSLVPGRPAHPKVRDLRTRSRRVIALWVGVSVPVLLIYLVAFLLLIPHLVPLVADQLQRYQGTVQAALRGGDVTAMVLSILQLFMVLLPWLGTVLIVVTIGQGLRRAVAQRWGWTFGTADTWRSLRRGLAAASLLAVVGTLFWRVAAVAGTAPETAAELRMTAALGNSGRGADGFAEVVLRAQLSCYVWLTHQFGGSADTVTGARQLAVAASAVLVLCFLAFGRALHWPSWTLALPLLGVAAMGPAVSVLAHLGPGLVGVAWLAVGAVGIRSACRVHGRHRLRQRRTTLHLLVSPGAVALVVGVATEPLLIVPLALGAVLLVHRAGGRQPRVPGWTVLVGTAFTTAVVAGLTAPALLRLPASGSLSDPERQVLLLVAAVVVAGGAFLRPLRGTVLMATALLALAALPVPGADAVLPPLVWAGTGLAALIVNAWIRRPVAERPHPLLRAALAVPVLVLVVVGSFFTPGAAGQPDGAQVGAAVAPAGGSAPSGTG